jgi:hypothetical protein
MTKDIRQAVQFPSHKQAVIAAKVIGWQVSDATEIEIMGFRLWSIQDSQCNYLTREEFERLATARALALTPAVN